MEVIRTNTQNLSEVLRISENIRRGIRRYTLEDDVFIIQILDLDNKTSYEILYDPSRKIRTEESKEYKLKDGCIPYKSIKIKDEEGILEKRKVEGPVYWEEVPEAIEKLLEKGELEWIKTEAEKIKSSLEKMKKSSRNLLGPFSYLSPIKEASNKIESLLSISDEKLHYEIWKGVCREHPEYKKIMYGYSFSDEERRRYLNKKKEKIKEILESHGFEKGSISVKSIKRNPPRNTEELLDEGYPESLKGRG